MEWIKVINKMPEEGIEVLTLRYRNGSTKMGHRDKYLVQEWCGDQWTLGTIVTHWMPLPESPNEKL